jgi:hypothetical protein
MNIIYEQPGTILIIGVIAEVIALGGLMKTGQRAILIPVVVIPLLTIGLLGLERYIVTDREEVRDTIHGLAQAVENNDLPAVLEYLSDRVPDAKRRAKAEFPRYQFDDVSVKSNLEIEVFEENVPPKASATFNVTVLISERSGMIRNRKMPVFVELTLYEEEGRWRIGQYDYTTDAMRGMRGGP